MDWRGTLALAIVAVVVGAYLWVQGPAEPVAPQDPPTLLGEPRLHDPSKFVALISFQPAEVSAVRVRHGDRQLSATRQADGWEVSPRGDASIDAFLRSVSELGRVMEIPVTEATLADFGLNTPGTVVELTTSAGGSGLRLAIGAQNPAATGVYVRVDDRGPVILAGSLLLWEVDKLFRASRG